MQVDPGADLLRKALDKNILGGGRSFNASGAVNLHVEAPTGTKVRSRVDGDLFKEIKIDKGRTMTRPSTEA